MLDLYSLDATSNTNGLYGEMVLIMHGATDARHKMTSHTHNQ